MADLENGLYAGWENNQDQNISTNTPAKYNFVTAVVVGDVASQNAGKGRFALYAGDATTSHPARPSTTGSDPPRPATSRCTSRGRSSSGSAATTATGTEGEWFEGVMASGAATTATLNSLQANIASAGYGK